jgi:hypothetical protein
MMYSIANYGLGYFVNGSNNFITNLFSQFKCDLIYDLEVIIKSWEETNCTIIFNEWSNATHWPLFNI